MHKTLACRSAGPTGVATRPLDTATGLPLDLPAGDGASGAGQQCLEGTCYGSTKGTTCPDAERNGTATDVDRGGGGECPTCENGADCRRGSDKNRYPLSVFVVFALLACRRARRKR